jgi:branched-chain amino acid transport system substrate-binding protein
MKFAKLFTLIFLVFALALSGCVSAAPSAQPAATQAPANAPASGETQSGGVIKIGALLPLTGGDAVNGQNQQYGHEFAIKEINALGGIKCLGGAKLQMVYGDSA